MNKEDFVKELKKINIDLKKDQLDQLDKYYNLLTLDGEELIDGNILNSVYFVKMKNLSDYSLIA